jgi:beta-lactam-binding protein with PASTA domain
VNAPGWCTVPDLSGTKLAAARRLLAERHCGLGRIRWRKGGTAGYIWSQRPYVGAVLPKGGKVNLVVSRGLR